MVAIVEDLKDFNERETDIEKDIKRYREGVLHIILKKTEVI